MDAYVIFKRPKDAPDHYLVRRYIVADNVVTPTSEERRAGSLFHARCFVPPRCDCRTGIPVVDEPQVVETWI